MANYSSVRVPEPVSIKIRELADSRGITRNQVCLTLINRYLDFALHEMPCNDTVGHFRIYLRIPLATKARIVEWESIHGSGLRRLLVSALKFAESPPIVLPYQVTANRRVVATFSTKADALLFIRANDRETQRPLSFRQ